MKILENTLEVHWDKWSDPGDYPSNAGGGPLPDGEPFVDAISGHLIVELEWNDALALTKFLGENPEATGQEMLAEIMPELGIPVTVTRWETSYLEEARMKLYPQDWTS